MILGPTWIYRTTVSLDFLTPFSKVNILYSGDVFIVAETLNTHSQIQAENLYLLVTISAFYSLTQESVPVVSSLLGNTADLSSNTLAQRLGMQYGSHVQIFIWITLWYPIKPWLPFSYASSCITLPPSPIQWTSPSLSAGHTPGIHL